MRTCVFSVVCLIPLLFTGCSSGAAAPAKTADTKSADKAEAKQAAPTVVVQSWEQIEKQIAEHRGKVVVIDIWSTYCEPCVREFPHFVALQTKHGEKVRGISLNTDYAGIKNEPPESFKPAVLKFLVSQKAQSHNVICSDTSETLFEKLKLGGPPAVFVYDRTGKLAKRFDNSDPKAGEFTYKTDVNPFVEKLLAQP